MASRENPFRHSTQYNGRGTTILQLRTTAEAILTICCSHGVAQNAGLQPNLKYIKNKNYDTHENFLKL
jgi:hypothetical protein